VILDLAGRRRLSVLRQALTQRGTLVLGGGESGDRFFRSVGRMLRAALWSTVLKQRMAMLVGFGSRVTLARRARDSPGSDPMRDASARL
jgi:hypothetical protein